ncbi:MAG: T9SS type A sorting domain-containing protein [Bacteroidetes bacterium]|nr:T9SS type A sorting domain-containing protein [Bacteroidota bacterium]
MRTNDGCITYDYVTVHVSEDYCCPDEGCDGMALQSFTLSTSQTYTEDEKYIDGVITVPANKKLTLENTKFSMSENAKIVVQPGGQLELINSTIVACDGLKPWEGIEVTGNHTDANQVFIQGSKISGANNPVLLTDVKGALIENNIFVRGKTVVTLQNSTDYVIKENKFYNAKKGISTSGSALSANSEIEKNFFAENDTAIHFKNANNSNLNLHCNHFIAYSDYAVFSDSSIVADQGTASEDPANFFVSPSNKVNHQLHHNGNSMNYYVNPMHQFALLPVNGTTAATTPASSKGHCFPNAPANRTVTTTETAFKDGEEVINEDYLSIMEINGNDNRLLAVPNPANQTVYIHYSIEHSSNTRFVLMNLYGQVLEDRNLYQAKGVEEINLSAYSSGMYFYGILEEGKLTIVKKLVVSK